ncbi:tRNA (adenosine(37)-N6)-threonylcarbamoyltransferase complex dimerization subunit type 1 TsaB [Sporohalobacter salinus]|uniref:tRNA (adenosine(37)-N6)-threonylcarbamoyltransferase complex dimerization subunit type 1 TsaB n=1 Tax=Sporohalobacter salinus TaxID=1494606 RepID=UPI00196220BF|nr:tRNA (adenosine(37)-N6)-threonylcarbamoyltransferase complex dimerization subunit type 1 TsaB [Sporohalobacter salinus]MBM7624047.1 tRNA threonylcarbamoyladenosine biosynthesis protein TsaB [Sporohalobacter salinus]
MLILALDSSTSVGAVCLYRDREVIAEYNLNLDETHSQRLMPQIVRIFEDARLEINDLEGITVGIGPGSFTGIRIGLATAKSLAHSLRIPLVGVSTLEVLASNILHTEKYICSMLDARRKRVYTCIYQGENEEGLKEKLISEKMMKVEDLLTLLEERYDQDIIFVGKGAKEYQEVIKDRLESQAEISFENNLIEGKNLARIGSIKLKTDKEDRLMELKPKYLKRSQAERDWQVRESN